MALLAAPVSHCEANVRESRNDPAVRDRTESSPPTAALEVAELVSSWVNTEQAPVAIARTVIESREGAVCIRTFGTGAGGVADWGEVKADGIHAASPSGREAIAFTASCERPEGIVELHANVSKGLLIITSCLRPSGQGEGYGFFAREFFRRVPTPARPVPVQASVIGAGAARTEEPSPGQPPTPGTGLARAPIFLGTWRNTQRNPSTISAITFSPGDSPFRLQVVGAGGGGQMQWGKFEVELLTDGPSSPEPSKIKGRCRLEDRDVLLHGWVKQGVLVLALFYRFPAGDSRSNYFDREFFYWEGPSTSLTT
jgi:hypothetical protein